MCQGTAAVASNNQESTKDHTEQDDPLLTRNGSDHTTNSADLDSEREVWEFMTPQAWHDSVASEGSIFRPTYQATIDTIRKTAEEGGYDVILEVGCGTGDIIGLMNEQKPLRTSITNLKGLIDGSSSQEQMVTIPCIGVDINH